MDENEKLQPEKDAAPNGETQKGMQPISLKKVAGEHKKLPSARKNPHHPNAVPVNRADESITAGTESFSLLLREDVPAQKLPEKPKKPAEKAKQKEARRPASPASAENAEPARRPVFQKPEMEAVTPQKAPVLSAPSAGRAAKPSPAEKKAKKPAGKGKTTFLRILASIGALLGFLVVAVLIICTMLLKGPSESARNLLVISARQASATKWMPYVFLSEETVTRIEQDSKTQVRDITPIHNNDPGVNENEWEKAIDGIQFIRITKPTFKAYLLIVKDPSRLFVGTSTDNFKTSTYGKNIFDAVARYDDAVAAINGGEFPDPGGMGMGEHPIGLTFAEGVCVWNDGNSTRTFIGFDKNNKMVVSEGMSKQRAEELGIRDGVCFQYGNTLISNDGQNMTVNYADKDTGTAQRTAIGQRADGAVLLLVTDGRTASSLGATHNEVIEILLQYGAIVAGKLDGGSSAMMYYKDYYKLYDYDESTLDEYQKMGLVNKYKAFTKPRKIPTFFIVGDAR